MRPWWLRPPADDDAESDAPQEDREEADAEAAPAEEAEEPTSEPAPGDRKRSSRGRSGRTRKTESSDDAPDEAEAQAGSDGDDDEADQNQAAEQASSGNGGARKRRENGRRSSKRRNDPPKVEILEQEIPAYEEIVVADSGGSSVNSQEESRIALFCDLENVALGVRDSDIKKFELNLVLERLLEKGKIIVKKAYCDWERYSEFKRPFHEAAVEMIDIPQKYYSGKNSADIKMAVDALELCYAKDHVDTFAILSGDSDFSPLVSKLREANKLVIGVGVKNSSSALLVDNCDDFMFYEDLWREKRSSPKAVGGNKKQGEAFNLMIDSIKALMRENKDVLWGSMVKQTMKRKRPSFNEGYHGYSTFSELLEDAEKHKIVRLKRDQRSGSYIITGFAGGR